MKPKTYTLAQLATLTQAQVVGDPNKKITGISDLAKARDHEISFLGSASHSKNYSNAMKESLAGAVFVDGDTPLIEGRHFLIVEFPQKAFQTVAELFLKDSIPPLTGFEGIHPTAVVHPTATLGIGVILGPYAVVDQEAIIGEGSRLGAGSYVAPQVVIGKNCEIHPRVVIREGCILGDRVILQPGAIIGSCGFGYSQNEKGEHIKLTHLAHVILEDDVEIGANTTIDRGKINPTRIERGTKIDNLVQIGHGVSIGSHNLIVAQTGIAGSTTTGKYVVLAGQVAVNGHIHITDKVVVAARSGVVKSIDESGTYGGVPAVPMDVFRRHVIHLAKLEQYAMQIKELQQRIRELEKQIK